ncbi:MULTISPECIES: four helix bundle protein [Chryseobacterium]|uniref:four helix bundle protein n=1 Tax=Chryseobacterium TaxID=59732 RepID=UPI001E349FA9|nr:MULTISPECIES: four helix bundle protein [Chryseobacterium]
MTELNLKKKSARISVVLEEIDEIQLWLEIIEQLEYISPEKILFLKSEYEELVKVITKYKVKLTQI